MKKKVALLLVIACMLSMSSCSIVGKYIEDFFKDNINDECNHQLGLVPAKSATCLESGYKAYYECKLCLELFSDSRGLNLITSPERIGKLEHEFINGVCIHCKTVDESKLPDDDCPHTERTLIAERPSTCQVKGHITYYLCVCGAAFVNDTTDELVGDITLELIDHDYKTGYCTLCGERDKSYEFTDIVANTRPLNNMLSVDGPLTQYSIPSVGSPNILVIPVNFDDSKATGEILSDIETAFNGTSDETGWESVSSYYYKSSYGKLNLNFDVLDEWFTPAHTKAYYNNYSGKNGEYGSCLILEEAMSYYDSMIDFSRYDNNGDDVIDAVWMIYNCEIDYVSSDSIYWAFMYSVDGDTEYDGVKPHNYGFAGIGFMYDDASTDEDDVIYDNSNIIIDAHTYIHETGHLMGLDDYYDYDEGSGEGDYTVGFTDVYKHLGLWSADMMDANLGDHCSISKLLLGWVTPTIIEGTGTITLTLESFTDGGGVIMISNHLIETVYDEYFLIELYTNTGLNANDLPIINSTGSDLPVYGIRVLHVDARKNYDDGEVKYNNGSAYPTGFKYDNSDEKYCFVKMLGACGEASEDGYAYEDALFGANTIDFGKDIYADYKYHSGESLNFTIDVVAAEGSPSDLTVTVTITVSYFNAGNTAE